MMQHIDADFDLLILGAGPAGLSAAYCAINAGKKVLMIDKGPSKFPHEIAGVNPKATKSVIGGIGGTARIWGGQCGTFTLKDEEDWKNSIRGESFGKLMKGSKMAARILQIPISAHNFYPKLEMNLRNFMCEDSSLTIAHTIYSKHLDFEITFKDLLLNPNFKLRLKIFSISQDCPAR